MGGGLFPSGHFLFVGGPGGCIRGGALGGGDFLDVQFLGPLLLGGTHGLGLLAHEFLGSLLLLDDLEIMGGLRRGIW
jgi:hypothetical protein